MAKAAAKPSALVDTRVIYCGDNLDQLRKFPDACVDLIYIDPPFNSNRNSARNECSDISSASILLVTRCLKLTAFNGKKVERLSR